MQLLGSKEINLVINRAWLSNCSSCIGTVWLQETYHQLVEQGQQNIKSHRRKFQHTLRGSAFLIMSGPCGGIQWHGSQWHLQHSSHAILPFARQISLRHTKLDAVPWQANLSDLPALSIPSCTGKSRERSSTFMSPSQSDPSIPIILPDLPALEAQSNENFLVWYDGEKYLDASSWKLPWCLGAFLTGYQVQHSSAAHDLFLDPCKNP